MLENKMVLDELDYIENDEYDNYLEYLAEEDIVFLWHLD